MPWAIHGIFLAREWAEDNDKQVGSTMKVVLADSSERTLTVRGLYEKDDLAGNRVVSREMLTDANVQTFDFGVYVSLDDGADETTAIEDR